MAALVGFLFGGQSGHLFILRELDFDKGWGGKSSLFLVCLNKNVRKIRGFVR